MKKCDVCGKSRGVINMVMKDWIVLTKQIASLSDFPKKGRRTGCIIVNKNRAVAVGWNQTKNRMGVTIRNLFGMKLRPTDHAETMALNKLERPEHARDCDVYVFRTNGYVSMPCDICLKHLLDANIRSITFTNREGKIVKWRNKDGFRTSSLV